MTRGRFITLEGGEGAGKSTQIRLLADALIACGKKVVLTREPGGSPGAEEIRNLLVSGETGRWGPVTEALLHTAARRDHLERTVWPALDAGRWVICDRFFDSTMAYQGYGLGLGRDLAQRVRAARGQRDVGAAGGEAEGDGPAQPAAGTGDPDPPAGELEAHRLGSWRCVHQRGLL